MATSTQIIPAHTAAAYLRHHDGSVKDMRAGHSPITVFPAKLEHPVSSAWDSVIEQFTIFSTEQLADDRTTWHLCSGEYGVTLCGKRTRYQVTRREFISEGNPRLCPECKQ